MSPKKQTGTKKKSKSKSSEGRERPLKVKVFELTTDQHEGPQQIEAQPSDSTAAVTSTESC